MIGDKFLIVDTSGLSPIRFSIGEGYITMSNSNSLLAQTNIQLCLTDSVLQEGESIYSKTPDNLVLKHDQFSTADTAFSNTDNKLVRTCKLTSNGTMTTFENRYGLEFKVFNTGDQTSKTNLCLTSNYSSKLSPQDKSNIYLAIELLNSGTKAAILANDWDLREQVKLLSIPVYGSSSFLAGMVLGGICTYQKAKKLYYEWKMIDPMWVPKDFLFKDVLSMERKRVKNNESFWFN